ncbi:adenylate/guanylate cyclase domain-containing protein [Teredinibacter waterburyi]|uniref:adenylate/guanylate cyclase domain-containing protein n=1 Tax=Teredinibacter waterburyi TaxID=1500538 RepID=UPI00165FFDF4|nr:adenylate/guanylate cyclase domain-containing protein [Teredinibacter waterburyi]
MTATPNGKDRHYIVLFADIVGSSRIYQQLGNSRAQHEIARILALLIDIAEEHDGELVKTIGDEIMVYFLGLEEACQAGIAMNLRMEDENRQLRTGMAMGPLIFHRQDVYGDTVNAAASLVRIAKQQQILVNETLFESLPPWLLSHCELFDRFKYKGTDSMALVYRLNWSADAPGPQLEATLVGAIAATSDHSSVELRLGLDGSPLVYHASDPPLHIGRDRDSVRLLVDDARVSRNHATIYFRRGKFIFEDNSTNGSYMIDPSRAPIYLRRESAPLGEHGRITLGELDMPEHITIHYKLS